MPRHFNDKKVFLGQNAFFCNLNIGEFSILYEGFLGVNRI